MEDPNTTNTNEDENVVDLNASVSEQDKAVNAGEQVVDVSASANSLPAETPKETPPQNPEAQAEPKPDSTQNPTNDAAASNEPVDPNAAAAQALKGRTSFAKLGRSVMNAVSRSPQTQTYTTVIITLAVVIFFVVAAIVPTAQAILSINNEIRQKRDTLASLEANVATVESLEAFADENSQLMATFDDAIPYEYEEYLFRKNIFAMADRYDVDLTNLQFSPVFDETIDTLPEQIRRIDVSFSVEGDKTDFIYFLNHLEDYHRIFTTRTIALINLDEVPEKYQFTVRGEIYLLRSPAEWAELNNEITN